MNDQNTQSNPPSLPMLRCAEEAVLAIERSYANKTGDPINLDHMIPHFAEMFDGLSRLPHLLKSLDALAQQSKCDCCDCPTCNVILAAAECRMGREVPRPTKTTSSLTDLQLV